MANFLEALGSKYDAWKDVISGTEEDLAKANYYKKAQGYLTTFQGHVDAAKDKAAELDKKIYEITSSQLEVNLKKSALALEISKVDVEIAALKKEYDNQEDALGYVKNLRDAYKGFVMKTEAVYPQIEDLNGNKLEIENFDPKKGFVVTFVTGKLEDRTGEVEDVLKEWGWHELELALDTGNLLFKGEDLVWDKAADVEAVTLLMGEAGTTVKLWIAEELHSGLAEWEAALANGESAGCLGNR
jgi:hypothetical protein